MRQFRESVNVAARGGLAETVRREVADIVGRQVIRARRGVRLELAQRGEALRADLDSLAYAEDQDWLPEASEA